MPNSSTISANIVDVMKREIYPGTIFIEDGRILKIEKFEKIEKSDKSDQSDEFSNRYIMPGFIDAHVHIESSMLVPSEFARLAVVHGTIATVSDPHEIGNVLGLAGVRYMIENSRNVPLKFYFGAPSCVPATSFETSGAEITPADIRELFEKDGLKYLSEMMNYPGVLYNDPVVMEKIKIANELGRKVDGHAPGLCGDDAKNYIAAGISTDHECFTLNEALDKLRYGMKIIIREGSAAKNFDALHTLIKSHPSQIMFCSDDKHPNDLAAGHINEIVERSVALGYDLFDVLQAACVNPVKHYGLEVGLLQDGSPADFIVVNNLKEFRVLQTYIDGELTADEGMALFDTTEAGIVNNFNTSLKKPGDFQLHAGSSDMLFRQVRVITANDGQLITEEAHLPVKIENGNLVSDVENDIFKLVVINRYNDSKPAIAFIKNFGLKKGAIASCVAHDSHNIIAVGVTDEDICDAINTIIETKGGISVSHDGKTEVLPLPIAGIMTNEDGYITAEKYTKIDALAKNLGTKLHAPFMTLSFMALLVIPRLKLSDKGLFDGSKFEFVKLYV